MNRKKIIISFLYIIIACFLLAVTASAENPVIVIDPGHGGYDGGTAQGIRTEKEYNLILATYLAEELNNDGRFEVYLTRTDDSYLKYLPRALVAKDHDADLLLSLHCNSNPDPNPHGSMAYVSVIDEYAAWSLAGSLLDGISGTVDIARGRVETREDTGDSLGVYYWDSARQWDMPAAWHLVKRSDYYSINTWASKFGIPSIIIEHGYLSNAGDAAVLDLDENLRAIAKAEATALINYYYGHTHSFGALSVDYPSSCTLIGRQSSRCTVCGLKTGTTALSANAEGHFWRQSASAKATCEADGFIDYICQISYNLNDKGYTCDVHSYRELLPATGHSYEVLEDTSSSHGHDGRYYKKCSLCGDEVEEIRPGEPHTYRATSTTEPDCEKDGGILYVCSRCGDSYTEEIPSTGHAWEVTEAVEATDERDGYMISRCGICGLEQRDELHRCDHEFEVTEELPGCENAGSRQSLCVLCGYTKQEELPSTGHSYTVQMSSGATCVSSGYRREKCSICGKTANITIPALGHVYQCVEESGGVERHVCTVCGAETTVKADRRSLSGIFSSPLFLAITVIILLQFAAVAVILYRSHKTRSRKHDFHLTEADEREKVRK